jgi:23S rRNA maturation mini-RNase III
MTSSPIITNNINQGVLVLANDITQMVSALKDQELERMKRKRNSRTALLHRK